MLPAAKDQPAYVLHRRAFRETSAIVELLTADFGRVAGVVRGVKGGRRSRYCIEPFTPVSVAWRGRGQLVNVLSAEALAATRLEGDALFAGLYLNELLIKTLEPQEPVTNLFRRYGDAVAALARNDGPAAQRTSARRRTSTASEWQPHREHGPDSSEIEPALRCFEKGLLEELGYGLAFDVDIKSGTPIRADSTYLAVDGEGFRETSAPPNATVSGNDRNGGDDSITLTGADVLAMGNEDFDRPTVRGAAKRVFRRALTQRLAGKPLNTRALFVHRATGGVRA